MSLPKGAQIGAHCLTTIPLLSAPRFVLNVSCAALPHECGSKPDTVSASRGLHEW
jgi:hypothetical protein